MLRLRRGVENSPRRVINPRADDRPSLGAYISPMSQMVAAGPDTVERTLPQSLGPARRIAPAVIAVIVAISFAQHPVPALTGNGLAVALSLVLLIASAAVLTRRADAGSTAAALAAMIVGSVALVWLQPNGAGVAGLFLAVAVAGMRLADRQSLAALALAVVVFIPAAVHGYRSGRTIAGSEVGILATSVLGIAAFYLVARFARSAAEAHLRTRQLLVELQDSRDAEAEAALLRERSRLARDMHDVLAHSLSGLMLQLEGARMLAAQPDAQGQLPPALDRAHHLARAGLEEARRAIAALRDADLPGPNRLERLASDFERDSDIRAELKLTGTPRPLDSETSLTLYRVAQEALTNARKHGFPERVELCLTYETDGTRLMVCDHASATASANRSTIAAAGGYGLTGMRERAELIGGHLDAGWTDDGFRVELWIPA
jgi:signal transduction histidine kinase